MLREIQTIHLLCAPAPSWTEKFKVYRPRRFAAVQKHLDSTIKRRHIILRHHRAYLCTLSWGLEKFRSAFNWPNFMIDWKLGGALWFQGLSSHSVSRYLAFTFTALFSIPSSARFPSGLWLHMTWDMRYRKLISPWWWIYCLERDASCGYVPVACCVYMHAVLNYSRGESRSSRVCT